MTHPAVDAPAGTIALIGAGEYLERCRVIDEHLLGLLSQRIVDRPLRVVCLPTASSTEGEHIWRSWGARGETWFRSLGADATAIPVIDRPSADDPDLVDEVAAADLVYLSGGQPVHLYDTLRGTATWGAIQSVLSTGGVLAGCSAGAMVQAERIAGFRSAQPPTAGFGLLANSIVLPHFDEFPAMIDEAVHRLVGTGSTIVGIDGGTALIRTDGALHVIGTGAVTIWGPLGHLVIRDAPVPDGAIGATTAVP